MTPLKKYFGFLTLKFVFLSLFFMAPAGQTSLLAIEESSSTDYWQVCSLANFREADCWQNDTAYFTVARATGRSCAVAQASARKYADIWVEITYTKADSKRLAGVLKSGKIAKVQCTSSKGKSYAQIMVKYSHKDLRDILKQPAEAATNVSKQSNSVKEEKTSKCEHCDDCDDCDHENCDHCDKEDCEECQKHNKGQGSYFLNSDDSLLEAFFEFDEAFEDEDDFDFEI